MKDSLIEKRMYPNAWSIDGFIKDDQSLHEIIENDLFLLNKYNISPEKIANKIEFLLDKGKNSDRFKSVKYNNYQIKIIHSRKMLTCPWAEEQFERCKVGKGVKFLTTQDFIIKNNKNNHIIESTSLYIHLIRDHNFFGGPGTKYRIDPLNALITLELINKVDES